MQASMVGAVIILAMVGVYLICRLVGGRGRSVGRSCHREKDQLVRDQIAASLEESAPIHLDIGAGSEGSLAGGAVLAAAEATRTVSAQMAFADEPWVITGSTGLTSTIEKDSLRSGMDAADYGSSFDGDAAVIAGASAIEHSAGSAAAAEMKPSALHLAMGSFGPASALSDTMFTEGEILCVGGDDLLSQAVGTVTADAVYVGEQFTEIPGALDKSEKPDPALTAMDVMRWVLIAVIVVFSAVGLSGI